MTNGQIEQLQELKKCHCLPRRDKAFVLLSLTEECINIPLMKWEESWLRRLWHQYRPQIIAMRKNRRTA